MTECNRRILIDMQRHAKERGVSVILDKDEHGWITARYSDKEEPAAYFLELPDRCAR